MKDSWRRRLCCPALAPRLTQDALAFRIAKRLALADIFPGLLLPKVAPQRQSRHFLRQGRVLLLAVQAQAGRGSMQPGASLEHHGLHVAKELLLRAENAAGPADPDPPDEGTCGKTQVLHCIKRDQRPCAPEASLAMNCHRGWLAFGNVQELLDDVPGRAGAVREVQVDMFDAVVYEPLPVIHFAIEANDQADARVQKQRHIVLRRPRGIPVLVLGRRVRASESQHPSRQDPAHVAVLDFLEELIRLHIERFEVEQFQPDTILQAVQTV
mmetsp:Transcript_21340/g.60872  ORF Transcript_21340/g.60872 Transcript_21340/m.60872 type:complete len:269 (+) Transcript_21340:173-979(+)